MTRLLAIAISFCLLVIHVQTAHGSDRYDDLDCLTLAQASDQVTATEPLKYIFSFLGGGLLTALAFIVQSRYYSKTNLFNAFKEAVKSLEEEHAFRSKVYAQDSAGFNKPPWSLVGTAGSDGKWPGKEHWPWSDDVSEEKLNKLCRAFDTIGLMVRLGVMPVDIVATYFSRPTLMTWLKCAPFIRARRRFSKHPGFRWHFEFLVFNVVIPGILSDKGPWRGMRDLDKLDPILHDVAIDSLSAVIGIDRDESFAPSVSYWKLAWWPLSYPPARGSRPLPSRAELESLARRLTVHPHRAPIA